MACYAEWYAVELDGYLKGRMSDVKRFEAIKEVRNHFAEHVDELVAKGMDPVEAEKSAIKSFGKPRNAALNLLGQGQKSKVGEILTILGCFALAWMVACAGTTGLIAKLQSNNFPSVWSQFYKYNWADLAILIVALIGGTILTKKVPAIKMLLSGAIGVAFVFGLFVMGPELNFADVPKDKIASTLQTWKAGREASLRLAAIEKSILSRSQTTFENGTYKLRERTSAIAMVTSEAPKLLQVKPSYVVLTGTKTAGFLGPHQVPTENPMFAFDESIDPRHFSPETGLIFPTCQRRLQYYSTAEEAAIAWGNSSTMYGERYSAFGTRAGEQSEFIADAERYMGLSRTQLVVRVFGPYVGITFGFIAMMIAIGWLLTQIPNFTIQTSFRRRIA